MSGADEPGGVEEPGRPSAEAPRRAPAAGSSEPSRVYRLRTRAAAEPALAAVREAVSDWGGEWTAADGGGELRLPVRAGLRYGLLRARASAASLPGGSELSLEVIESQWALNRSAVLLLSTAAATAVAGVLWPFFPPLGPFVPLALVLGASAWLVILARLRHQGPAELLAEVEAALGSDERSAAPIVPR